MKRLWPYALLLLPALALLGRVDPTPSRPRITAPPSRAEVVETGETLAEVIERHFPSAPDSAGVAGTQSIEVPPIMFDERPEEPDSWKRSAITSSIVWFAHHQNEDGSFGNGPVLLEGHVISTTGITALALLSCLGHGYSHLSRDVLDGKELGGMVRRALRWMLAGQRVDGTFPSGSSDGFEQALGALALTEAYGMTASSPLKEPAARSLEALGRMQKTDGSWGGPAPTAWALLAVRSADLSELPVAGGVLEQALRYGETTSHRSDLWNRLALAKNREGAELRAAALASSLPAPDDFAGWYHTSGSLFRFDGPGGPVWKSSSEMMKQTLLSQHAPEGPWFGSSVGDTLVRSSLAMLTLQLLYHSHGSVFGAAQ